MIEKLEAMLAAGHDNALLRLSLGAAYLKHNLTAQAAQHLEKAVLHDPEYSAAWKNYGNALVALGRLDAAQQAYETGIAVANKKGDIQAAKEMGVFLKRIRSSRQPDNT